MIAGEVGSNFFELETVLKNRLEKVLEPLEPKVKVFTARDLNAVKESALPLPSVSVMYAGYAPRDTRKSGTSAVVEQRWMVVISARNVRDTVTGAAARDDAGVIASYVCHALMGFFGDGMASPVELIASNYTPSYSAGRCDFPLLFQAEIHVSNPNPNPNE